MDSRSKILIITVLLATLGQGSSTGADEDSPPGKVVPRRPGTVKPPHKPGRAIVDIYIHELKCHRLTPERPETGGLWATGTDGGGGAGRDEVFVLYKKSTGPIEGNHSTESARLPRRIRVSLGGTLTRPGFDARDPRWADYYEFSQGHVARSLGSWTNRDRVPLRFPLLHSDILHPGGAVHVVVAIMEQDGKKRAMPTQAFRRALVAARSGLPKRKPIQATHGRAMTLMDPEKAFLDWERTRGEVIGGFVVSATNTSGLIHVVVIPLANIGFPDPKDATTILATRRAFHHHTIPYKGSQLVALRMAGAGSAVYSAEIGIRSRNPKGERQKRHTYLGKKVDRCSKPVLWVAGMGVRKGQRRWARIASPRFDWYCSDSKESSRAPEHTNLLLVQRDPFSRRIIWYCFEEN